MKKTTILISGVLIFFTGCVNNGSAKPKEHTKTVVKEIKTIEKKYIIAIDEKTKQAMVLLIEENRLIQARLLEQQKELQELKKATLKPKTVHTLKETPYKQQSIAEYPPGYYTVKTFAVNIRKFPTTVHSRVVSCLYKGDVVKIIDKKGNWGKLEDGTWISFLALEKVKNKEEG